MKTALRRWSVLLVILAIAVTAIPAYALPRPIGADPILGGVETPVDPTAPAYRDMAKEPAPIELVAIVTAESSLPEYSVHIVFGLPSGCVQPGGYEVERDGNEIRVAVSILTPTDPDIQCTTAYDVAEYSVPLGSDFQPGETYTVDVNGMTMDFTAQ